LTSTTVPWSPLRINSGGGQFADTHNALWLAEQGCAGGWNQTSTAPITGTSDPGLYQSVRIGLTGCSYPVPNGTYIVTLKLVEPSYTAAGRRKMDVRIENQLVLDHLDVFAVVGRNAALDRTFTSTVTDGVLDIAFVKVFDNPLVAAIEIVPASGPGTVTPTPTFSPVATSTSTPSPTLTPTSSPTPTSTPTGLPTVMATPTSPVSGSITPTRTPTALATSTALAALRVLAADTFECGTWSCGTGWLGPWTVSGAASINNVGAHGGTRQGLLTSATGQATRAVDVGGRSSAHWQVWVRTYSFEASEQAVAQVSTDGVTYTTLRTWTTADPANVYRLYDFDLSPYLSAGQLYLRLSAKMSDTGDYFYFDDVVVTAN